MCMNSSQISRRRLLLLGTGSTLVFGSRSLLNAQQNRIVERNQPPKMDTALIGNFVGACHRDIEAVRSMLKETPGVVNASFNRGGSDWESGMEAAAHMGRTDIADVLIEHKARKCIFWAAMAGEEAIVKAFVQADSGTVNTGGAHNISLMAHAAICGKVSLTSYLKDQGARIDNKSLEHAVRGNRKDMVEWLVDNGANPKSKDIFGNFHYDTAEKRGFKEISAFLRGKAGL